MENMQNKILFYLHFRASKLTMQYYLADTIGRAKNLVTPLIKRDHFGILYLYNWGSSIHKSTTFPIIVLIIAQNL